MKHVLDFCGGTKDGTCVAFGHFDGIHLGHRAVIEKVCAHEGLVPVIVSADETFKPVIYTEREKEELLKETGVEIMVSVNARDYDSMTADELCSAVAGKLNAKVVVAGENICFGSDNKGMAELKALGEKYGFAVEPVPVVYHNGEEVSTAAVMKAIEDKDFNKMSELLGHVYIMMGRVVHGKAAGRKHGMPTANLGVAANKLFPPHGVYGTLSIIDGRYYRGMTNIGLRPSDDDIPIATIETFILNFDQDIYEKDVLLQVYAYIRGVKKFSGGLDEVRKQIDKDIQDVKSYMDEVVRKLGI